MMAYHVRNSGAGEMERDKNRVIEVAIISERNKRLP